METQVMDNVTQAWLYEHHEFGRQIHETRWDEQTGGTADDFIGWTETPLVSLNAALAERDAEVARLREALNAIVDRGPEQDSKWFGMTAKNIAIAALAGETQ
ncbi:hypothetical protein UFOVP368_39 [uncultured Caudovirales phage]|uniref:Uncharacterized protein n=1 Tax=uncultured Caudovirales phage TaxID=2100421 RepID=A0A6J7X1L9_9CAUD|nr:hypothetical protein UFOVP368_39 [uncultured Caudovirales phage]